MCERDSQCRAHILICKTANIRRVYTHPMPPTSPGFFLTPFGLTNLALLLLTTAFFIFLAQSRPRSAAGCWMLAHEASLALFLAAQLLLYSTFLPA